MEEVLQQLSTVILDKEHELRLSLACLLARGHLLIEDVPGVGKTTLVKALAKTLGLKFNRIQMTNDLLPADIVGGNIFDQKKGEFIFHKGPLFSQLVLGDELNRATPKTQSATLQAMEEHAVSVDGVTYELPMPFFFIATQNPRQQIGTFPLPESQLDRFLMRISLGFPSRRAEGVLYQQASRMEILENLKSVLKEHQIGELQSEVDSVRANTAVVDFLQDLIEATRSMPDRCSGLSPRAGLGLLHAAKAWALLEGRNYVVPEDIQAVGVSVMAHRLGRQTGIEEKSGEALAKEILANLPVR